MAAFAFIWHLVEAELRARGHDTVAPDLPCEDDSAGLPEYADTVADAAGGRTELVVVVQSMGGFIAPHTPALSRPRELADGLEAYATEQGLTAAGPRSGPG